MRLARAPDLETAFPVIRVIGFSMMDDPDRSEIMRRTGTVAHVRKSDSAEVLLAAIRRRGALPA